MKYRTWLSEDGETEESGTDISAFDARGAAQERHEEICDDGDHVQILTVSVRDGAVVRVFVSEADFTVRCWASEKKAPKEAKS